MTETRDFDDHTIKITDMDSGPTNQRRVYINGNDVTERALEYMGPRKQDRMGPVPWADGQVLHAMISGIQNDDIVVTEDGIKLRARYVTQNHGGVVQKLRDLL